MQGSIALVSPSLPLPKPPTLSWLHEVQHGQRKQAKKEESEQLPGRGCGRAGAQLTLASFGVVLLHEPADPCLNFLLKNIGRYGVVIGY